MDIPIEDFEELLARAVLRPLLEYCAKEVMFVMQYALETNADGISTTSLQNSVTYEIVGNEAVIFIDYEACQTIYEEPPEFGGGGIVEWGRFTNVFDGYGGIGGGTEWEGDILAFKMAEWLEEGAYGSIGNNPIEPTHWFTKIVANEIKKNLRYWIEKFFYTNGLKYKRTSTKGA